MIKTTCRRTALIVSLATLASCGSGRGAAERTIFSFVEAVQSENLEALPCLLAGAAEPTENPEGAREAFELWARSRYDDYLVGRDDGQVDLGDDGIVLTKAFALGKGTFYEVSRFRRDEGAVILDTRVRFAYAEINISGLPPGTVFYACGRPIGAIEAVTIPRGSRSVEAEVLETVEVRWTLVRSPESDECPERWTVASVVPLPETATTREIVWEF